MGEMCCTAVQPRLDAEQGNLRRAGLREQHHGQHADGGPPVEPAPRRREHALRRRQRQVHQEQRLASDLASPGHAERRRGHFLGCLLMRSFACSGPRSGTTRIGLACSALLLLTAADAGMAVPHRPPTMWLVPPSKRRSRPGATAGNPAPWREWSPRSRSPTLRGARATAWRHTRSSGKRQRRLDKKFTVRLVLAKPDRVQEVKYYVLGQGPVMVFRDEDYQRNINMEDGPKAKSGKQKSFRKN